MKLCLVNKNPIITKLVVLSANKAGLDIVELEEIDSNAKADIICIDDESYESQSYQALKAANPQSKFALFYSKTSEKIDGFDEYIHKPFLPTDLFNILSLMSGVDPSARHVEDENLNEVALHESKGLDDIVNLDDLEDENALPHVPEIDDLGSVDEGSEGDLDFGGNDLERDELAGSSVLDMDDVSEVKDLLDGDSKEEENDLDLDMSGDLDLGAEVALDDGLDDELSDVGQDLDIGLDLDSTDQDLNMDEFEANEGQKDDGAEIEDVDFDGELDLTSALESSPQDTQQDTQQDEENKPEQEANSQLQSQEDKDLDLSLDTMELDEPLELSQAKDLDADISNFDKESDASQIDLSDDLDDVNEASANLAEPQIKEQAEIEQQEPNKEQESQNIELSIQESQALQDILPIPQDSMQQEELDENFNEELAQEPQEIQNSEESQDLQEPAQDLLDPSLHEAKEKDLSIKQGSAALDDITREANANRFEEELNQLSIEGISEALGEPIVKEPPKAPIIPQDSNSKAPIEINSLDGLIGALQTLQTQALKDLLSGATIQVSIQFPKKDEQ